MSDAHSTSPDVLDALAAVLGDLTLIDEEAKAADAVAPDIRLAQDAVERATTALGHAMRESHSVKGATDDTLRAAVGALTEASRLVERARRTIGAGTANR